MENNQFRGFDVISELGSGAFSKTMLADQDGKRAVIKIIELPNEATINEYAPVFTKSPQFTEAMRNTGTELHKLLKTLTAMPQTTGILKYYDYTLSLDSARGIYTLGILMQYDTPLYTVLAGGDVPVGAILRMGSQLCEGLETMLKKFVVHGNIKESNIFYNQKTGFALGDFYINDILSTSLLPDKQFKSYGYRFLAPEAYTGGEYSFKTDIFSLGMMLYKIFNHNHLPYDDAPNTPLKKIKATWDSAKSLPLPALNIPEITRVLAKATAYNIEERYVSFMQFKNALDRLLATLPKEVLYTKIPAPAMTAASTAPSPTASNLSPAEAAFHPTAPAVTATPSRAKPVTADVTSINTAEPAAVANPVQSAAVAAPVQAADEPVMRARSHVRRIPAAEQPIPKKEPEVQPTIEAELPESQPIVKKVYTPSAVEKTEAIIDFTAPAEKAAHTEPMLFDKAKDDAKSSVFEEDKPNELPITPKRGGDRVHKHNPLLIPAAEDTADEAAAHQNVRPLRHYEQPAGITEADSKTPPPITMEPAPKKKRRTRIPNEDFNYFDFNSEEFTDTSPKRRNKRFIIFAAVVLGVAILAITAGFISKFLIK